MSKLFRKIAAVFTALILVSVCGISVFAAGNSLSISEDYDNDRYLVEASASIGQYYTQGSIWLQDKNNSSMMTTEYRSVSVSYNYLMLVGVNAVQLTGSACDTAQVGEYNASVYVSKPDCYHMVSATYTFEADIPCSYGTQEFRPDPITLIYYP